MLQHRCTRRVAALALFPLVFVTSGIWLGKAASGAISSASAPSPPATSAQQSGYLGGDTCLACHEIGESFAKNPHYKSWKDESLSWSERGCEPCHGPGFAHVNAGGDPTQIFNFKSVTAQEISDTCLNCHLQKEERANFLRSEHGLNTVACTECHTIHTPDVKEALLAARTPALCYGCHAEVRPDFNKPFHHKVHEGWMGCTDCHNQHGGFNPRQTRASAGSDVVCYECHADTQGPFVFEHAPVRVEGCAICHDVHGSTNPRMLKRSEVRFLCLECHAGTPGVLGRIIPLFHDTTQARWQHCTDCHVNIHGSNISPFFFE